MQTVVHRVQAGASGEDSHLQKPDPGRHWKVTLWGTQPGQQTALSPLVGEVNRKFTGDWICERTVNKIATRKPKTKQIKLQFSTKRQFKA